MTNIYLLFINVSCCLDQTEIYKCGDHVSVIRYMHQNIFRVNVAMSEATVMQALYYTAFLQESSKANNHILELDILLKLHSWTKTHYQGMWRSCEYTIKFGCTFSRDFPLGLRVL